ncbi:MAG: exodeoxyribonuclease VII small subunit [bacterium]|nr:exodeoxyribonuclease VII small subunit [bacterium]
MGSLFGEEQAAPADNMTFKQGLDELEGIIRALEGNQLELEESLGKYARGVELLRSLQGKLDDAQQRITVLLGEFDPASIEEVDDQLS